MCAHLLMLVGSTAIAAPVPHAPEKQVSEKVIQVWKDAGAEVRWVTISGLWDDKPTPGCRVGFYFHGWVEGRFDNLPAPEAPFKLDVSFPWPGDEDKGIAKEISDGGLKELVKFQNLQSLGVFGRNITDAGAKEIAKLKNLEQLSLSCTKVTTIGLKELTKLQSITRLTLGQMDVTEEMLGEVAEFKNLTRFFLSFNKSEVTIAGMKHISKLEKLEKLNFFDVNVSDRGVKELGQLKNLKDLDFLNTNVTKASGEELQKLLPKCDISVRTVDLTLPPWPIPMNFRGQ
jgi:hypothetical protein